MCGICGCGSPEQKQSHKFVFKREHQHHHDELDTGRLIQLEQDLLSKNNTFAMQNRAYFKARNIFVLNLVSSPGAGKTTLLVETIKALNGQFPIAVIEGDQQTEHDADRIRATGTPALQINTGRSCHLEAQAIGQALNELDVKNNSLLAIENVGNLVCPSSFDLGEAHKVVVLSVTEGDDKPLKYPDMFHAADLMLINKTDLLPYVDFDVERCVAYAKRVNPNIHIICLSSTKGDNFTIWINWLEDKINVDSSVES
ncbi:MAG: hydrogenase nickel incorporation protein HypB [Methylococcaceae bacterium]|nr:hydrogenase nickel incorporation protein HypB [Methylococcaceae bacterium]